MSRVDSEHLTKLRYLRNWPQPFLVYTKSVIYRGREVLELEAPSAPAAKVVIETDSGKQSVVLSGIEEIVIEGDGHMA